MAMYYSWEGKEGNGIQYKALSAVSPAWFPKKKKAKSQV